MTKGGDIGAAGSGTESANHSSGPAPAANSQPPAGETTGEAGGDIVMALPEEGGAEIGANIPGGKTQSTAEQPKEEAESLKNQTEGSSASSDAQNHEGFPRILLLIGSAVLLISGIVFAKHYT